MHDPEKPLAQQLKQVRHLAEGALRRFARQNDAGCGEVYLLDDDRLCGIRFQLGPFHAEWRWDNDHIAYFRGEQSIGCDSLCPEEERRRAA